MCVLEQQGAEIAQMKNKKIGVLLVHGIGRQALPPQHDSEKLMYSSALYAKLHRQLARYNNNMQADIAWVEANYAHVFNDVQSNYYARLGKQIKRSRIRQLVIENLGDAATYRPRARITYPYEAAYERVQASITSALEKLEAQCQPMAPLIVLAHSLGGQVMMDYFLTRAQNTSSISSFTNARSLKRFITFGCNIPLFMLGQSPEKVEAISHPAGKVGDLDLPWWLNFYDRDDVLGYPLIPTGAGFEALGQTGQLQDIQINAGNVFTRWNTLSHMAYWRNDVLVTSIAEDIVRYLK
ncbi:hypothetical protein [Hirschia litorea]|uniref:Uncharacterized protein n=1 Tax=Hirschia litorea TaxID=1199156 RepID=A0ABW2ILG0_9PROT